MEASQLSGSILLNLKNNGTNILSQTFTTADTVGQIRFYSGNIDPTQEGNAQNQSIYANNIKVSGVPEPSTYALLGLSAMGMAGYMIRRRRQ